MMGESGAPSAKRGGKGVGGEKLAVRVGPGDGGGPLFRLVPAARVWYDMGYETKE